MVSTMSPVDPRPAPPAPPAGAAGTGRLFVACWPSGAERGALQAWQAALDGPAALRRTPPEDLHLTLVFIGDLPAERLPAVRAAVAAVPPRRTRVTLDRLQVWHGGTVVLAATRLPPALHDWQQALVQAMQACGLAPERRRFRPHVTLARRGQGAGLRPGLAPAPVVLHGRGPVLAVRQGPHYTRLWPPPR